MQVFDALGDRHRLQIVDALGLSDRSPSDLQQLTGLPSNLLAFHLDTLVDAGLAERRRSAGDGRRRYVRLRRPAVAVVEASLTASPGNVVFVCTHNSARSQMAAGLWHRTTGQAALSAGTAPAPRVHPLTVEVAGRHGLDLSGQTPRGYADIDVVPDLVVSVCDRAHEAGVPWRAPQLHWSVTDPAGGDRRAFERAYADVEDRVARLADVAGVAA